MSQVDILREDIERLRVIRNGAEETVRQLHPGTVEHGTKQAELTSIVEQIKQREKELEALLATEEAINEVAAELEQIEVAGKMYSIRDFCSTEEDAQIVSIALKKIVAANAEKSAALASSLNGEITALREQNAELESENTELRIGRSELEDALEDAESKRDAAAKELDELKQENERLRADRESLRKQLEERPVVQSKDEMNEIQAKLMADKEAAKEAARIKYYNEKYGEPQWTHPIVHTKYRIYLAETGEQIEVPFLEINNYKEITKEEAERFRQEKAAEEAAKLAEQNVDLGIDPPAFRDEEETTTVPEHSVDGEMDDAPVTQAQIRAIEDRLQRLEQQTVGRAVA